MIFLVSILIMTIIMLVENYLSVISRSNYYHKDTFSFNFFKKITMYKRIKHPNGKRR